jgi:hypothetical protein
MLVACWIDPARHTGRHKNESGSGECCARRARPAAFYPSRLSEETGVAVSQCS